ncbi:starvation-inducible DNA-binding protein [Virgibacillus natechei]|uniref:Starvation-inducible DNA-binding protein n=1 Tax=Virgibacillus natechei TaxID=1216297 RepID=A0ABS4IDS3_9BACI|nr:DNA starvation/stationary phase protection protein [Virgibacillus natechei]MBP1969089.1 starvation-inducible DNA-binding protein [Virgibacillus natechei]UZD14356.1 DNA starvation/stationary phase protection protein [Virgibacillus natechei]
MTEHNHDQPNATAASEVNHLIANQGILFVKLHQYHWHVQGPHFFTLHEKFEELYNESNQYFDAFAERLIVIGERPYSTLAEYLEHASISEETYETKIPAEKMVSNLVNDYRTIRDGTDKAIELAAKEGDNVTEDMLVGYKESLDKNIWMLQAYLGNDALEGQGDE